MHNYESSYKRFPSASVAGPSVGSCGSSTWIIGSGFSWRVMILPQIEQKPIYDQFNFTTMGMSTCYGGAAVPNATLSQVIDVYQCPSDDTEPNFVANRAGANYAGAVRALLAEGHDVRLDGVGVLRRVHEEARVEARPDNTRVLFPPRTGVRFEPLDAPHRG